MPAFKCNSCFVTLKPLAPNERCYFTKCSHLLCINCTKNSEPNCGYCKEPTKFMTVREDMPTRYRSLFENSAHEAKEMKNSWKFMATHSEVTMLHMNKLFDNAKNVHRKIQLETKKVDKEIEKTNENIAKLKIIIGRAEKARREQEELDRKIEEIDRKRREREIVEKLLRKKRQQAARKRSSPEKQKFYMSPSQYRNAPPQSPRTLDASIVESSRYFNPPSDRSYVSNSSTWHFK
ncbi:RING finger protein nenya-like [Contarinia nasturtii]|uniref:RING finger protein nenya-like n=1 Tax=Contarinia nasturtii TaxID=265458 RepID=UPI0012D3C66B|nr:RING finger protein nenya-like [Contarinia nasturtii]XP_031622726.1 RING finger protein nenya-like [Contarinia nasturtii]XP_031622729.1 RING finger protein nenya-like [Contarinia nasturtii]